ncbi:hypothetical protein COCSUDRAFT_58411 [Coccomyxa subellipsoidea C-169]|uniref:Uncharacterized protein n=1 Tax=Coccomyxa subellipsoidea (strain C-169) TaxID=574566 RepID=I0YMP9_COCSC|nr:hypothetical protein COCSUDRAFT_58411 [Coccomyxa subellipsoidea C-169]EIE19668.1 hypothetical protein COCSUDRAFT_58411 [Coccomyxa subellipsoidea C-169]|eukprot:XP_005644212.1 hypothetical protein COCSUDRAFT_58411 [Coccomyxa subellipsoidea C-169]
MTQQLLLHLAWLNSALERKARLYDRLASGQHGDEDELYNVYFVRKGTLDDEGPEKGPYAHRDTESHGAIDSMTSADLEMEQHKRKREEDEWDELEQTKRQEARRDDKT